MMNKYTANENSLALKRAALHETLATAVYFSFGPMTILAMYLLTALVH